MGAPQAAPGASFFGGDSVTVVESGLDRFAFSARTNAWSAAPPKLPILLYAAAVADTTFGSQALSALIRTVTFYDDRRGEWIDGFGIDGDTSFGCPCCNGIIEPYRFNSADDQALWRVTDFNDLMLMGTLSGVEMGLGLAGVPHQKGGCQAAMRVLEETTA